MGLPVRVGELVFDCVLEIVCVGVRVSKDPVNSADGVFDALLESLADGLSEGERLMEA